MISARALIPVGLVLVAAAAMLFLSGGRARSTGQAASAVKIGTVVRDCADCPDMVAVPQLGHDAASPGTIFYAGRTEVTWRQYLAAVRDGACRVPVEGFSREPFDLAGRKLDDDYPITEISPDTFVCYLDWLKKKSGKAYRIPSAAEWEHVARAGTKTEYYWGNGLGRDNAIVFDYFDAAGLRSRLEDNHGPLRDDPRADVKWLHVYPVRLFKPNPWGLYDVIGNAAELTSEAYPPFPACVKTQPSRVCEMLAARGMDNNRLSNPTQPNPPITSSLTTARYRTPAHGGAHGVGFRVIRS